MPFKFNPITGKLDLVNTPTPVTIPGGSFGDIQFNNSGAFGGIPAVQGDLIFGSAAGTWSKLAKNTTATRYLSNTGTNNSPAWGFVNVANGVTGVLPVANGGTGLATPFTAGSVIYSNGANEAQNNSNFFWNQSTLALQVGSNATVNSNVKFLMRSGSAGVMGYPYEVGVFERNGDTKLGIYNSSPTAGGSSGAALTFGFTNLVDNNGFFPGLEFQFDGSTVPTESKAYFTFLQRNYLQPGHANGDVVAVPSRPLILVSSGRAGVMCDPFDTFVVQGGIHSTSYVNSFQEGEHLMDWGVANNARVAAIGDSSSPYPNYNVQLHSDSSDTLPVLNPILITGDDTYFQANFGINTVPIKTFHVSGNGAESGMVVFDDTFSGNRMVFGNSGGTSDLDMNIWTNTGGINFGDGSTGVVTRWWNGGSGVNAQVAADGNHTYFVADGNGYVGINTASPSALFYINDRGLGATDPSFALFDNDLGNYAIVAFTSSLRQIGIGGDPSMGTAPILIDYANFRLDMYDPNSAFAINARIAAGSTDDSWLAALGGNLGVGTSTPTGKVSIGSLSGGNNSTYSVYIEDIVANSGVSGAAHLNAIRIGNITGSRLPAAINVEGDISTNDNTAAFGIVFNGSITNAGGAVFGLALPSVLTGLSSSLTWAIYSDSSAQSYHKGNFGLNVSVPTQLLDVNGSVRLRSSIYDQTNSAGSSGNILANNGSGGQWQSPVAAGVTQVVTTVSLTNQGADIGSTNFTGANIAGLYRVNYSLQDTTADATAGAVTLSIAYTDGGGSTTFTSAAQLLTGSGRTSGTLFLQLSSGSISYSTAHTGLFGTAKYALYMAVERVA